MIQSINSAQNVNFSGRFLSIAASHLLKNLNHYTMNAGFFTVAPFCVKSPEDVLAGKILMDTVETLMAIFRNQRTPNGFANFNNPLTNTMIWTGKGTWKILEKLFPQKIHY